MKHPFAITLEVGTSKLNHTGSWRTMRPEYVDRLPPCNAACPAGEDIQGWLSHAEAGEYEAAWRALTREQSAAGDHGPRLLSPLRNEVQSRRDRRGGRHQFGRTLSRRPRDPAWLGFR